MNLKRKRHKGTHYLSCRQFSGLTFGSLVSKWKNYFNYCTALNYSLWRKWWQVCRAITLPLPLASLSVLMKKPLHTTQSERDRERGGIVHWFSNLLEWLWIATLFINEKKKYNKEYLLYTIQGQQEPQWLDITYNPQTVIGRGKNIIQTAKNV